MDPRLLELYNQELRYFRESGAEFARLFPKIAARLGMEGIEVADPYVERLLEGVAFLAARVRLKLDAEFPRFTSRLLDILYPHYLAPTPSMLVAQFQPDPHEANLARGVVVPRGTALRAQRAGGEATACEFRTAQEVTLWPLEVAAAEYFAFAADLPLGRLPFAKRVAGGLRLKLRSTAGLTFDQIGVDDLRLFLTGADEVAFKLHELLLAQPLGVLVAPSRRPWPWYETLPGDVVAAAGFEDEEALLPVTLRSFQGYRLLQEYFAFPQRFLFADVRGIGRALRRCAGGSEAEVVILFSRGDPRLEGVVGPDNVALHCAPAINLFPRRADRIQLNPGDLDHHVVPDRSRPMDYEVHTVAGVTGHGGGSAEEQVFHPFYAAFHTEHPEHRAYYTVSREPRVLSANQKRQGNRSNYVGSEVFLNLVDPDEAPYRSSLRQLSIDTLCTNRDLPLLMPLGGSRFDFTPDVALPLAGVRCAKGPSKPYSPILEGGVGWRFIDHLSLNYLSLVDGDAHEGAAALREMLDLYAATSDPGIRAQTHGLLAVRTKPAVRRLPLPGPIAFGRGLEVEVEVDEMAFQGGSAFLFGAVLERFFARAASLNTFTETALRSTGRGEIMRWRPRCGTRPIF